MTNALLSIRTDDKTKKEITQFANSIGLSVSAFVTVVLKQVVQEGKVVLTPTLEPTPYLEKIMRKAEKDIKAGLVGRPMNKEEAVKHLHSLI